MFRRQMNGRSAIVPIAGEQAFSRLVNNVQSHFLTLVFRATLTIATAAAASVRNRGSVLALYDEIGIDENGTTRQIYDGRVLRFASEMAAPSALSAVRVPSSGAVGVYNLEEAVRIYFAHPFAAKPRETAYLERDVKQVFSVYVKLANNAVNKIAPAGGGGTSVLSNITVSVMHSYDASEDARPYFVPTITQQIVDVTGVNDQLQEFIKTSHSLRGLIVSQDTTGVGEVSDIINSLSLKGDFHNIIGPKQVAWNDLCLDSEFEFGGAVVSSNRAHLGLNFQSHGMLSNILNPNQDANLRFEFNVQPSVAAGAGTSRIRITRLNMERDPAIVESELPIPV